MKKLLLILISLIAISCNRQEDPLNQDNLSPKEYTVSIGFGGELSSENFPMSKSSDSDLYGIQVYSKSSEESGFQYYAYGLFDNINNLSINLIDGYKYKIECSVVINGKNVIESERDNIYRAPFIGAYGFGRKLDNTFHVLTEDAIWGLPYGSSQLKNYETTEKFSRPNTDRYYGMTGEIIPSDENSTITIYMKRTVYEAGFIAEGLTEGRLKINVDGSPTIYINSNGNPQSDTEIYTFNNVSSAFEKDDYFESVPVTVVWEKDNGSVVPVISSQKITFKRKVRTITTINLNKQEGNNNINIEKENPSIDKEEHVEV